MAQVRKKHKIRYDFKYLMEWKKILLSWSKTFFSFGTRVDKFNPKERNCNSWTVHGQHSQFQVGKIINLNSSLYIKKISLLIPFKDIKKENKIQNSNSLPSFNLLNTIKTIRTIRILYRSMNFLFQCFPEAYI